MKQSHDTESRSVSMADIFLGLHFVKVYTYRRLPGSLDSNRRQTDAKMRIDTFVLHRFAQVKRIARRTAGNDKTNIA